MLTLVTADAHIFGAKSILPFTKSRRILISFYTSPCYRRHFTVVRTFTARVRFWWWWCYPILSERRGSGWIPLRPNSRATLQGVVSLFNHIPLLKIRVLLHCKLKLKLHQKWRRYIRNNMISYVRVSDSLNKDEQSLFPEKMTRVAVSKINILIC